MTKRISDATLKVDTKGRKNISNDVSKASSHVDVPDIKCDELA